MTIRCIVARDRFTAEEVCRSLKLDPHNVSFLTSTAPGHGFAMHLEELFVHSLPDGWTDEHHFALMMCIVKPSQPTGKMKKHG
jgi:hypothetical protein